MVLDIADDRDDLTPNLFWENSHEREPIRKSRNIRCLAREPRGFCRRQCIRRGFGDAPEAVAKTVRRAAEAGLIGCTSEDATKDKAQPIYPFDTAVERITAGVEAMNALDFDFKLTGRCENFLRGNPDLEDTIRRLQVYVAAGAKVLMAPGLPNLEAVRAVCDAVSAPFNFMVGIPEKSFTFAGL